MIYLFVILAATLGHYVESRGGTNTGERPTILSTICNFSIGFSLATIYFQYIAV